MLAPGTDTRVDFERGMRTAPPLILLLLAVNVALFAGELAVGALASRESLVVAVGWGVGCDFRGRGRGGRRLVPPPEALLPARQADRLRAPGLGGVPDFDGPPESLHRQLRTPRGVRGRSDGRLAAQAEPLVGALHRVD